MIKQLKNKLNLFMAGNALAATMALTPAVAYAQTNEGTGEEVSTTEDGTGEGSGMFDSTYTSNQPTSPSTVTPEGTGSGLTDIVEQNLTAPDQTTVNITPSSDSQVTQYNTQIGLLNFMLRPTGLHVEATDSNVFTGETNIERSNLFVGETSIVDSNVSAGEMRDYVQNQLEDLMNLLADDYVTRDEFGLLNTQVTGMLGTLTEQGYQITLNGQRIDHLDQAVNAMGERAEDMYSHLQGGIDQLREYVDSALREQDRVYDALEGRVIGLNLSPALGGLVNYNGDASARLGLELALSPYDSAWTFTLGGAANLGPNQTDSETTAHPAETTNYNNGSHTVHSGSSTERTTEQTVAAARVGVGYEISDNLTVGAALEAQFRGTDTATSETSANEIYNRAGELQSVHQVAADERLGADSYDVVFNPGTFLQYNVEGLGLRLDVGFQGTGLTIQYDLLDN